MKILFCFTYSKSFLSGFFFDLCKKLTASGKHVVVFSLKKRAEKKNVDGIPIIIERKGGHLHNYLTTYKIIKSTKPDIIISNFNYVYPALLCGTVAGTSKNIAWFHTESSHTKPGRLNVFIKKWLSKLADKVIVNSPRLQEDLISTFSMAKNKIHIVPFWTAISNDSLTDFNFDNSKVFKIGCPGRLVEGKNHEVLIDALVKIKSSSNLPFKLYIPGRGDKENKIKKYIVDKGLGQDVVFLGDLSIDKMPGFYTAMDLVVLPSLYEAFGFVFIETISLGVPVLVSNRFGALEFIKPSVAVNNFQFDPLNDRELAYKITQYMNGQGFKSTYFKKLYHDNFSRERTFNSFEHVLK
ncbi:glycosyltransferase family 4 protein [Marixanthomonas spongiae]|uniref:Glycosyltransferase n=1 Tax=Marixanthomonas spongiae TaxID=2174845 RepID=A0A2U0I5V0_9FLAO|nr:glycosyltransferase family 4 protein [Marixanthomonas spongiae]PVW16469.1 hypothetical protein DDV96_04225 [Marixanthomonas spongiae]